MQMLVNDFHVAAPTAFNKDESINVDLTLKHIDKLYQKGVRSVLICGSTGEQHSLSFAEKIALVQTIEVTHSLPEDLEIIFGVADISLTKALKLAQTINNTTKISAVLLGFSPYILPSQQEAAAYATALVMALNKKAVILYNNPNRTGFDLTNETFITLLQDKNLTNIIGIKEAGNPDKVKQLIEAGYDHLSFFVGGEPDLKQKLALGFNGLSSILGNIYPIEVMSYFSHIKQGTVTAEEEQVIAKHLQALLSHPSILPALKAQISLQENSEISYCRSPLGLV